MVAVDGKLFAIGGWNGNAGMSSVERFDPKNSQWQFVSRMQKGRFWHDVAVLDGLIYVCGGKSNYGHYLRDCERYNQERNRWEMVTPMNKERVAFNLVTVSGQLYAVGKFEGDEKYFVESYDPKTNKWTILGKPLIEPGAHASAVVL